VPTRLESERVSPTGFAFAISSYVLWGFLPVLFYAIRASGAVEIVAWRIVLSLAFCVVLVTVVRGWRRLALILRDRRATILLALAAIFILGNWLLYIFASTSGHVVEASLGYFINPIITALLGVIVLGERLRWLQWVALGVGMGSVVVLGFAYQRVPFIALGIALSFGLYGLVKKRVGPRVDAISGLTIETGVLVIPAAIALLVIGQNLTIGSHSVGHLLLMLSLGIATAVPLLLFASAARRLPLSIMGLIQYVAPVLQLIAGVVILKEHMTPERWIGFAIVWVALVILTVDMFIHAGSQRRIVPSEAPGAP
jgi:chloramphenicol-sensitive protein RarD